MRRWLIPAGIIVVLAIFLLSGYNNLVRLNEAVNSSWSQLETSCSKSGVDPEPGSNSEGYAAHEEEIFTQVRSEVKVSGAATVSGGSPG